MEIKLERAFSRPGVPNANGVIYPQEVWDKAVNDVKKTIRDGMMPVVYGTSTNYIVPLEMVYGELRDITGEDCTVKLYEGIPRVKEFIELYHDNKNDFYIGMSCMAELDDNRVVTKISHISSFSILPKRG